MTNPKAQERLSRQELRCVWMTAGILTYRLCDRNFECDGCLLNAALRGQSGKSDMPGRGTVSPTPAAAGKSELREGYLYSRNHCWAKKLRDSSIRVGLEPGLRRVLLTPKAFVLPSQGQCVQKRQTCLWIVVEGGTLPVESPCAGSIRAINHELVGNPHLLLSPSFNDGWFFEIETDDSLELSDFLDSREAELIYGSDQNRFEGLLSGACRAGPPGIGVTMADGGQPLQNMADVVGPDKYFSILRKVFSP